MTDEKIPCRLDEYQVSEMDGELLLYHAGKTEVLYLNEPAAMVWYLCDGERRVREIVELLCESYPDAADSIPTEVDDALRQFLDFGGIELK